MTNAEKILITYNKLDLYLKKEYGGNSFKSQRDLINSLYQRKRCSHKEAKFLESIVDFRNILVHEKSDESYFAEPNNDIMNKYEKIVNYIINPPKAYDFAVKKDICTATINDKVYVVLKMMLTNNFSYIPIIENDKVQGIFSEHSIFAYLESSEDEIIIDLNDNITCFNDFIAFNSHPNERFEFYGRDTPFYIVRNSYHKGLINNKRLGAVLITQNGNKYEKLLGLLTPWDILRVDEREYV